jgi:hypothetical protein
VIQGCGGELVCTEYVVRWFMDQDLMVLMFY